MALVSVPVILAMMVAAASPVLPTTTWTTALTLTNWNVKVCAHL